MPPPLNTILVLLVEILIGWRNRARCGTFCIFDLWNTTITATSLRCCSGSRWRSGSGWGRGAASKDMMSYFMECSCYDKATTTVSIPSSRTSCQCLVRTNIRSEVDFPGMKNYWSDIRRLSLTWPRTTSSTTHYQLLITGIWVSSFGGLSWNLFWAFFHIESQAFSLT